MAQINNLPQHIRNGTGLGSIQVVGWLPIVIVFLKLYLAEAYSIDNLGF